MKRKTVFIGLLSLLVCLILLLVSPDISAKAASKVSISDSKKTIYVGNTYDLQINGTSQYVKWKSSNSKVATVNNNGKVKGIKAGKATITATVGSGKNGVKYTCKVTVKSRIKNAKEQIIHWYADEYEELKIDVRGMGKGDV